MLILFDLDDTLIDHTSAVDAGVAVLHRALRLSIDPVVFRESWTAAMREHFPRYLRGEVTYEEQRRARLRQTIDGRLSDASADDIFADYFRVYEAAWSLFPDVLTCLEALAPHTLGIISNGNGVEQRRKLARTGIAVYFQFVHISTDCGYAKPDSGIFRLACHAANCSSRDAVYVGDVYDVDAAGARGAGLTGVWLDRWSMRSAHHDPPIINGLNELPGLVQSLVG